MMDITMNDLALLGIALVIGLILGLMISGRGKFKRLWHEERGAHRSAIKDRDARLEAANKRIAELERDRGPIGAGTAAAVAGAASGGRDDLSQIRGVSQQQEIALNEAGYHRFDQVAAMNGEQEATLEGRLGLTPGTIGREDWRGQASELAKGGKRGLFGRLMTPV